MTRQKNARILKPKTNDFIIVDILPETAILNLPWTHTNFVVSSLIYELKITECKPQNMPLFIK